VDPGDEIREPRVTDRALRGRARPRRVEPGLGHFEDSAPERRGETVGDHHIKAANLLWVGPVLEQLGGPPVHGQLRFEFTDALARRHEFGVFRRRQPGLDPAVDAVLATPVVDRLIANAGVGRDVRDLAAHLDQIEHTTPELRRIRTPSHAALLSGQQHHVPTIRLHGTPGGPDH
jgi:hypothetical protein